MNPQLLGDGAAAAAVRSDPGDAGADPAAARGPRPSLSVVVPVFNEAENVAPLIDEIAAALADHGPIEIIYVDDGSTDDTVARLSACRADRPILRVLRHDRRSGQSAAVRTGVAAARAPWIVTLDGDGQNDPADLPRLIDHVRAAAPDRRPALVGGLRLNRRDTWSRRLAGRFANLLRQSLLRDGCSDTGCGLKLFRRDAFLGVAQFGATHRFLPALFRAAGHATAFLPVGHRPRRRGTSKYGNARRAAVGLVDLLGVLWLTRRTPRPPVVSEADGDRADPAASAAPLP